MIIQGLPLHKTVRRCNNCLELLQLYEAPVVKHLLEFLLLHEVPAIRR